VIEGNVLYLAGGDDGFYALKTNTLEIIWPALAGLPPGPPILRLQLASFSSAVQTGVSLDAAMTYTAKAPAVLRSTQLPLPPSADAAMVLPAHDSEYWAQQTAGFDFSGEDKLDAEQFNRVLWTGLMGGKPYPEERDGQDLRKRRNHLQ